MKITYDPVKNEWNIRERGLSFDRAADDRAAEFDFETATIWDEERKGEVRRVAAGSLEKRLHILCYRAHSDGLRVISFRKANDREARKYGRPKTTD